MRNAYEIYRIALKIQTNIILSALSVSRGAQRCGDSSVSAPARPKIRKEQQIRKVARRSDSEQRRKSRASAQKSMSHAICRNIAKINEHRISNIYRRIQTIRSMISDALSEKPACRSLSDLVQSRPTTHQFRRCCVTNTIKSQRIEDIFVKLARRSRRF